MCASSDRLPDSFEEPLRAAHALMRQRKGEEACRFLLQAKEHALSEGAAGDAALYSSVRGSYLVAMGRDGEALAAYEEAGQISEDNAHYQLTTARHLVVAMGEADKALEIVNSMTEFVSEDPEVSESEIAAIHREAHVIRGLAFLTLDQPEKAITELDAICFDSAQPPSLARDLTLVEEFLRRRLAPALCSRYLDLVEAKAQEEEEYPVLAKVVGLKEVLSTLGSKG